MPSDLIDLRGPCPKETIDVLDAISLARGLTRTQLVNEVLGEWARIRLHEMSVMSRVLRRNPDDAED